MEFFAVNGKRPIHLSEATRQFALDSLNHKYGLDTRKNNAVSMDDIDGFEALSDIEKYDAAITKIASKAPIRICEGELVSGAATLGLAIDHTVPATYNGKPVFSSVSHLTIDFETVLKKGVNYIEQTAIDSLNKYKGTEKEPFIKSCLNVIDAFKVYHKRYLDALSKDEKYKANYNNLLNVPFAPANSFCEAVQSLWFTFSFVRLCGDWPGIGRIDWLLGDYLKNDLKNKVINIDNAREILAHFFIKGCEWICGGDYGSGDAQHYQNILLAGVDENGAEVTNEVTYLVLDIIEELGISDFPTTVRLNKNTDQKLLTRVAEVIRYGGGVIAVYNEDLIIQSLTDYGYDLKEARKFANDGCWEVQIPGKTYFLYNPFDALALLQKCTLKGYGEEVDFNTFEEIYADFIKEIKNVCLGIAAHRNSLLVNTDVPAKDFKWRPTTPCTVVSVFEQGCIQKGQSYLEGGPVYNVFSPHIGGLPDAVNSLYAIKKLVFDEKKLTLKEFLDILKNNWQGNEPLRQYVLNKYTYFGNDNDEVDLIAKRVVDDFAECCKEAEKGCAYKLPAGVSTFGRQIEWSYSRLATPSGKLKSEVLAGNFSPTPNTDTQGATAIIRSYCKSDLKKTVSGAALDIKLLPSVTYGENGLNAIVSLLCGFVTLGGHFMQLDIADAELLKKAQENPEEYSNLSVRVSGWNARFVTLNKEWQDMIINQAGSDF